MAEPEEISEKLEADLKIWRFDLAAIQRAAQRPGAKPSAEVLQDIQDLQDDIADAEERLLADERAEERLLADERAERAKTPSDIQQDLQDLQDDITEAEQSLENIEEEIKLAPFIAPTQLVGLRNVAVLEVKRDKLKDDIKTWKTELVVIKRSVERARAKPDPRQQERISAYQDYLVDKAVAWATDPLTPWEEATIRRIGAGRVRGTTPLLSVGQRRSHPIRAILERIERRDVDDWQTFVKKAYPDPVTEPGLPPIHQLPAPTRIEEVDTVALDAHNEQAIREWIVSLQNPDVFFPPKSLELESKRIDQTLVDMVKNIVKQAMNDAGIDYIEGYDEGLFYQVYFADMPIDETTDEGRVVEAMYYDTRLRGVAEVAQGEAVSELQKLEELPMGKGIVPNEGNAEIYLKAALKDAGLSTEKIRELNTRAMAIQLLDIAKTELVGEPQVFRQADGELVVDPDVQHRKLVELATELAQTGKVSDLELIYRGIEDIPVAQELMNAAAVAGTLPETLSDDYTKYLIGEATRLTNDWMAEIARKGDKVNRDEFVAKRAAGLLTEEELAKQLEDEAEKKRRTPAVIAREELDERSRMFWSEAFRTEKMSADATPAQRNKLWLAYDEAKGQYDTAKLAGQQPNFEEIIAAVLEPLPVIVVTEGARRARDAPRVPVEPEFTGVGQPMISSLQDSIAAGDQRLADIEQGLSTLAKSDAPLAERNRRREELETERETLTENQKTLQAQLEAMQTGATLPVGVDPTGPFDPRFGEVGRTAAFALAGLTRREEQAVDDALAREKADQEKAVGQRVEQGIGQRVDELEALADEGDVRYIGLTDAEIDSLARSQLSVELRADGIKPTSREDMSKKLIREGLRKDLQMEPRPQMLQPGGFPAGTPLKLVGDIVKKIDLTGVGPGEKIPGGGRLATAAEQEEAADAAADAAAEQEEEQEAREAKRLAAEDAARVAAEAVVPEKTAAQIAEEEADVARRQRSAQRKPITTKIIT